MYWWHAVSFTERQADDVMLIDSNLKVPPSEPSLGQLACFTGPDMVRTAIPSPSLSHFSLLIH